MNKVLTSILAGAIALGVSSCTNEKNHVDGYAHECPALEMENGYTCEGCLDDEIQDTVLVTDGQQVIGAKLTVKSCEQENYCLPPVSYIAQREKGDGSAFYVMNGNGTPNPASARTLQDVKRCREVYSLIKKCEQLLEQKYKKNF